MNSYWYEGGHLFQEGWGGWWEGSYTIQVQNASKQASNISNIFWFDVKNDLVTLGFTITLLKVICICMHHPSTRPIKSIGMPYLTCDYKFSPWRHPRIQLYSARPATTRLHS